MVKINSYYSIPLLTVVSDGFIQDLMDSSLIVNILQDETRNRIKRKKATLKKVKVCSYIALYRHPGRTVNSDTN